MRKLKKYVIALLLMIAVMLGGMQSHTAVAASYPSVTICCIPQYGQRLIDWFEDAQGNLFQGYADCGIATTAMTEAYFKGYTDSKTVNDNLYYKVFEAASSGAAGNNYDITTAVDRGWIQGYQLGTGSWGTQSELQKVYDSLAAGKPVMIHRILGGSQHWGLVYKYTGSSTNLSANGFGVMSPTFSTNSVGTVLLQTYDQFMSGGYTINSIIYYASGIPTSKIAVAKTNYQVTVTTNSTVGGKINMEDSAAYAAGSKLIARFGANESVYVNATPEEGYEFAGWTTGNGGTFANASSATTTFIMPTADTTVTANFRQKVTPTYTITATPAALDFGTVTEGYTAPIAQTVTVTNTGNQTVTLTQPTATNYTVGALSTTSLAPNATATFTVTPKTGLAKGSYNETITVSTGNSTIASMSAAMTVEEKPVTPIYTITAAPATLDFGTVTEGYTAPAAQTVTVTNTGNQTVTLTQPTATNYTVGTLSTTSLAPNATATFTVTPKTGLAKGSYNETITVSTGNSTIASVSAAMTVEEKPVTPIYTISAAPAALDFGTVTEGYTAPIAQTVTVTNTGNQTVTLTQPMATNYTIGTLSTTSLAPNAMATFTVTPKAGLTTGSYGESITIAADKTDSITVQIKLQVQQAPVKNFCLSVNEIDFGEMAEGYQTAKTVFVTVQNTGNRSLTFAQPSAEKFTVGAMNVLTLEPNATTSFPVTVKEELKPGRYTEKVVVVSGDLEATLLLKCAVTAGGGTVPVPNVPKTGDETPVAVLFALLLSTFGTMVAMSRRDRRHHHIH